MVGFENYCWENNICKDLKQYFANTEARYTEFIPICTYIRAKIQEDQIGGGMAGIYNPSITQRLNNLTEKVEQTQIVHTINLAG